jgi:hypothetical protein
LRRAWKGEPQALGPGMKVKRTFDESHSAAEPPVVGGATESGATTGAPQMKVSAVPMVPRKGP